MSPDTIAGCLDDCPFSREYVSPRNLVLLRAEIAAVLGLSLQFSDGKMTAASGGQRKTPKLVLANDGTALEKVCFGPIECFNGRLFMMRRVALRCWRMQGFALGIAELPGPIAAKLFRRDAAHFPIALLVRKVLADRFHIRTLHLRMLCEKRLCLPVDLRVTLGKSLT